MNNDFERDNWLEEERARERKISIWSMFDNRKDVFDSHMKNCDRREVEMEHRIAHQMADRIQKTKQYSNTKMSKQQEQAFTAMTSIIIAIIMMIIFLSM